MTDQLVPWDPTTSTAVSSFDFGTVGQGSSADVALRVKNQSTAFTAIGVEVSFGGTGSQYLWLSTDGQRFTPSIQIGDLLPSALSDVFYLRRVMPSDAPSGAGSALLDISGSWS